MVEDEEDEEVTEVEDRGRGGGRSGTPLPSISPFPDSLIIL